ncbi:hypothetical protein JKP88DRAFT_255744 [Tribonema minus]|uniref:Uncharacterized protein n=1 Tax=Tribonema minus TaxID=303371 RepID=A0A836CEL3_9STRA|nr:hypothetical protein JKP88DRAFT_255744 [Tribonema minus]
MDKAEIHAIVDEVQVAITKKLDDIRDATDYVCTAVEAQTKINISLAQVMATHGARCCRLSRRYANQATQQHWPASGLTKAGLTSSDTPWSADETPLTLYRLEELLAFYGLHYRGPAVNRWSSSASSNVEALRAMARALARFLCE